MNQQQNALKIFEEELGELAVELLELQKIVSKAIRFGANEKKNFPTSNHERIQAEWNDLLGSIVNLSKHGIDLHPNAEAIAKKIEKIDRYTEYSKSLGQVTPTSEDASDPKEGGSDV